MSDMCVDCRQTFPSAQLDMSPNGWRCQRCKLRHDIDVHAGADDQVGEISIRAMEEKAKNALLRAMGSFGLAFVCFLLIAAGVVTFSSGRYSRRADRRTLWVLAGIPIGFAYGAFELTTWRRAKKAIQISEARNRGDEPTL